MPTHTSPREALANRTVAVYGASGHTGRFVVRELLRRGFVPVAVGRSEAALAASLPTGSTVAIRPAAVDDARALDRAFAGAAAVINCAGPFLDTATAVLQAAMRERIHYIDVTAEQASAMALFDTYEAAARSAGIVAVPAMGFYGGLGDLLATAVTAGWEAVDDIRIAIALNAWWPTAGTRRTGERNTATRLTVEDGRFVPLPNPAPRATHLFPAPFGMQEVVELPFTETVVIARHLKVANLHSYLNEASLRDVRDATTPAPTAVDDTGRSGQVFAVDVTARGAGGQRRITATGQDIYAFTAPLVVEAVSRILEGQALPPGVRAAGELFDAVEFLSKLQGDGFAVHYHQ